MLSDPEQLVARFSKSIEGNGKPLGRHLGRHKKRDITTDSINWLHFELLL